MANTRYIVVVNYGPEFPCVRHIIKHNKLETLEEFKEWYYTEYEKLPHDEFHPIFGLENAYAFQKYWVDRFVLERW